MFTFITAKTHQASGWSCFRKVSVSLHQKGWSSIIFVTDNTTNKRYPASSECNIDIEVPTHPL